MLSLEERLAMLDSIIESKTPEQIFQELIQFEAVGPKAEGYLEEESLDFVEKTVLKKATIHVVTSKKVGRLSSANLNYSKKSYKLSVAA